MQDATPFQSVPNAEQGSIPGDGRFPVVGIGASAGGLPALNRFFENMPADSGMAFVVILHLSSTHQSKAAEVLQFGTMMPVRHVTQQVQIEKNHVYVISPNTQLGMSDGVLQARGFERRPGPQVVIDLFFRTLADAHRERAIAVVLSGTGADGAVGLARVKELGGVTIAQRPEDAEFPDMPSAAIETGAVDLVLPVGEMPRKLIDLWENMQSLRLPAVADAEAAAVPLAGLSAGNEKALVDIVESLRLHTGHDFRHYKRATVIRRIERRMQVCGLPDLDAYRARVRDDADENIALLNDLLIGVTNFFRDREAFEALERDVIPQLFEDKSSGDQVRVWVAACSTGEEAYSLAMLLCDRASTVASLAEVQVFATDIDERAIAVCRRGIYPESIAADIAPVRLRQFFTKEDRYYRTNKTIRDKVLFAPHNLLKDPPFSRLDLISCRNLLIYLTRDVQTQLLEMFHFALKPGGYLFLGSSESADALANFFTPVDKKYRIYRAKAVSHASRYAASLPMTPVSHMSPAGPAQPAPSRKFSLAQVHQRALAEFAPPSIIVNRGCDIVHMSERAGRFLRHVGGEPSNSLISQVLPELRLELRTALFQSMQHDKSVEARGVQVRRDDRVYWVNMVVRPFHDDESGGNFVLVLFDEIEETMRDHRAHKGGKKKDAVMEQLEDELQRTKEQLQETIEQAETSTEELKASNEELQAINEELRSATEELETSKEELQSINEELVTVNQELKLKVDEAGKINDDLNNLIASADIATVFIDRGMRIKRYTPGVTAIFNIIPSDIGRSLLDVAHRLDYDALAEDAAAAFESLRLVEREVRSGDGRFYLVRMLPYRTTEDRIDGAIMTFIDISSRRRIEEQLRASEQRMRLVAESTKDYAIITQDADGRITSWNNGAERIFGYAEDEVLGRPVDLIFVPEDVAEGVPAMERRVAVDEGRAEDQRWLLRKGGTRIYCEGVLSPLRAGGFDGYAKIARESTGRMEAEIRRNAELAREQIQRAEAQAENTLKDQFLAVMSHELKQPLNLIHINAELLTRLPEVRNSQAGTRAAAIIQRTAVSLAKIIDDLLDLSRLSTGKLALNMTDVDLSAVVNSIAGVVQGDTANGLTISVEGTDTPRIVHADPVRVEQIVWNLLSNAVKFTPAGGRVAVRLTQETHTARLDVEDTGQGITREYLPHIFDMFRQAEPATTRTRGGLGIGLALVRQLVNRHGGRVEAASAGPNKGARFSVWLPLHPVACASLPAQDRQQAASSIAGLRILLVDDMRQVVDALGAMLEMEGAQVIPATSAGEALRALDEQDVDVIVSDISMPGMDGYAFIEEVRRQARHSNVPAIAATGLGRHKDAKRALAAGFSAHISKPISVDALIDCIQSLRDVA